MKTRLLILILAISNFALPQTDRLTTSAGRQFQRWIEIFNRADRAELGQFLKENFPSDPMTLDEELAFREQSGGFDLKKIDESSETRVSGIVQGRDTGNFVRFVVEVEPGEPHRITALSLRRAPRPSDLPPIPRLSQAAALEALREEVSRRVGRDRFSGAVLVARHGKPVFLEAYGLSDREKKTPNRIDTRFRLGSMNKMFTAVAIAQLAQAGKLKLNEPITTYLPEYPNRDVAHKVTIDNLLTHTGGTGDIFGPQYENNRTRLRTLKDYVSLYGARGLEFEPGSRWAYSNYGYLLLGVLVEKVSGEVYYDYVRNHIYKPARMRRSDSLAEDEPVKDRSIGYTRSAGQWKPNTNTLPYRGTSAGGGYSTVEDLLRFANALLSHKLLDSKYTTIVSTGKVATPSGSKYAYGLFDVANDGVRYFGHGGGAPGMNGELRIFPDSGYVVAVLANLDPPAATFVADFITERLPAR